MKAQVPHSVYMHVNKYLLIALTEYLHANYWTSFCQILTDMAASGLWENVIPTKTYCCDHVSYGLKYIK